MNDGRSKIFKELAPYVGMGVQLAGTMALMFFIGYKLDEYYDTYPVLMLIFLFLGIFTGIYHSLKTVLFLNKKDKSEK